MYDAGYTGHPGARTNLLCDYAQRLVEGTIGAGLFTRGFYDNINIASVGRLRQFCYRRHPVYNRYLGEPVILNYSNLYGSAHSYPRLVTSPSFLRRPDGSFRDIVDYMFVVSCVGAPWFYEQKWEASSSSVHEISVQFNEGGHTTIYALARNGGTWLSTYYYDPVQQYQQNILPFRHHLTLGLNVIVHDLVNGKAMLRVYLPDIGRTTTLFIMDSLLSYTSSERSTLTALQALVHHATTYGTTAGSACRGIFLFDFSDLYDEFPFTSYAHYYNNYKISIVRNIHLWGSTGVYSILESPNELMPGLDYLQLGGQPQTLSQLRTVLEDPYLVDSRTQTASQARIPANLTISVAGISQTLTEARFRDALVANLARARPQTATQLITESDLYLSSRIRALTETLARGTPAVNIMTVGWPQTTSAAYLISSITVGANLYGPTPTQALPRIFPFDITLNLRGFTQTQSLKELYQQFSIFSYAPTSSQSQFQIADFAQAIFAQCPTVTIGQSELETDIIAVLDAHGKLYTQSISTGSLGIGMIASGTGQTVTIVGSQTILDIAAGAIAQTTSILQNAYIRELRGDIPAIGWEKDQTTTIVFPYYPY